MKLRDSESKNILNNQSDQYRKGQVLGFTMAEIMLVLIFILLLLLGTKITKLTDTLENSFIEGSKEHESILILKEASKNIDEDILWLTETLVLNSKPLLSGEVSTSEVKDFSSTLLPIITDRDISLDEAKQCLSSCGGGPKACWGSLKNPDYIYNIELYDDFFVVNPNHDSIDKNYQDWLKIPLAVKFNEPVELSNLDFITRFKQLDKYGDLNDCVYQVKLFDVNTTTKNIYKRQEGLVQRYVYTEEFKVF
jgi:hypothetical protein